MHFKVESAKGNKEINDGIDPSKGLTPQQATSWFERIWKIYKEDKFFSKYEKDKGHEWADDDLKALIIFLTGFKQPGEKNSVSGYKKLALPLIEWVTIIQLPLQDKDPGHQGGNRLHWQTALCCGSLCCEP